MNALTVNPFKVNLVTPVLSVLDTNLTFMKTYEVEIEVVETTVKLVMVKADSEGAAVEKALTTYDCRCIHSTYRCESNLMDIAEIEEVI